MKKLMIAAAAAAMLATPAMASTDGALSTTNSSGTLDVTVNIPKMVRVSGLDDLTINVTPAMLTEPFFSREDATSRFCVYSNDGANGAYNLTVSANPSNIEGAAPYALQGTGGTLPYAIWTSDNTANEFKNFRFAGLTTTYSANADGAGRPKTLNCTDRAENASIKVGVNDAAIIAAQAGTYTDTITVTVSVI
jgi:spore coat protein U-like protein